MKIAESISATELKEMAEQMFGELVKAYFDVVKKKVIGIMQEVVHE